MRNRKFFVVWVLLALLLSLATACTKSDEKPTKTPAKPAATATQAPDETAAPQKTPETQATEALPTAELPPPTYDVARYGYLEALDPSGQEVLFWYPYTGVREELLLAMIDEFNRANEWGITVVGETWGNYDAVQQKIAEGIPTQALPSLAVAAPYHAATYATQEVLVALEPYLESPRWGYTQDEWGDFFPGALAADVLPQFKARYGWPHYRTMDVLYYNTDWLLELGYAGPPESWEQFEEIACKAIKKSFSKAVGKARGLGFVYVADATRFADFVISRGGAILKSDGAGYTFNAQAGVETLTFWQRLTTQGCATPAAEVTGDQADFAAGRALFTLSPVTWLPSYAKAVNEGARFAWGISTLPTAGTGPRVNISGNSQVIFANAPEEQLATWLFLRWLSAPEQQAQWASSTGFFPTRRSAVAMMSDTMAENPLYLTASNFMTLEAGVEAPVGGYDECRGVIATMLTNVLGGADIETELSDALNLCNEALWAAAPAEFTSAAAKPTPVPKPLPIITYSKALYGELDDLDPSGQEISYWHPYTDTRSALLQEMVEEFNRTNIWGITVIAETQGGDAAMKQAINAALAERRWPSLAMTYPDEAAVYAGQKALLAVEPYFYSRRWGYNQTELADFFPAALEAGYLPQFQARYGWSLSTAMDVLYYNQDWLKAMGFTEPPQTWEAFGVMACRTMTQPFSGAVDKSKAIGYAYAMDMAHFTGLVFGHGSDILKPDGKGYAFGGAEGTLALTLWHTLTVQGCATQTTAMHSDRSDFASGRALFTVGSTTELSDYAKAVSGGAQFAWNVSPLPHTTPTPRMNFSGALQSIFVSTPEEQLAAWLFLRWMSEPEQQARWADATGDFPVRQSARKLLPDLLRQNPAYAQAFDFMALDYGIAAPVTGYDQCRDAILAMLPQVLKGANIKTQLQTTVRACDRHLANTAP
ncbi:MAG TPA: extracellular solute-binding protein [Anaerolineae bacterium]|nr:extracellular solute-binding protein [Anaerolineae bacterium]